MESEYWRQALENFVAVSPRPWGWARWNVALARVELALADPGTDPRDILAQLLSVAPAPRSYRRWNELKHQLAQELGSLPCVCCGDRLPVAELTHHSSGQGMAYTAGMVCPECQDMIRSGLSYLCTSRSSIPLISSWESDYERLRHGKPLYPAFRS